MTGAREPAGRVIAGRYRLLRQLGAGGMGRVWLAYDQELACEVALKEISLLPGVPEAEVSSRIVRARGEARHAARLRDHPHVVTVHDIVEEGGLPWIVMAFVPGATDLEAVVRENGPLPPVEVARIGLAVLDALLEGHRLGILHRDVKPANVLLTRPGQNSGQYAERGKVLLADYGIALQPSSGELRLTGTAGILGSPPYMAPERARGEPPTAAADLFGLGATLYFALEGTGPFERDSASATLAALLTEDPTPPRRAGALAPVVEGLLAKDPAQRMEGEEAVRRLSSVADGLKPPPRTVLSDGAPGPERPEYRTLTSLPGSVPPPGSRPPPDQAGPGPEPARRRSRRNLVLAVTGAAVVLVVGLVLLLRGGVGGPSPSRSPSPSSSGATSTVAEAHRIVSAVPLSPQDWGPGYARSDPYEWDPAPESGVRPNCEVYEKPARTGTLAAVARAVQDDKLGFSASSGAVVYVDESTARESVADDRDAIHRCTNQHQGKARWADVHEAIAPELSGFDEVFSEEGRLIAYDDGSKANIPYVILIGRTGKSAVSVYVGGPPEKQAETRKKATEVLLLMQSRLSAQ
ncbi:serine/threonine-protein kinase [Streptomyces sp. NBC_00249]|uniref:serine/threonine-protein kinase n=1 Tax=Streptomyces sp. NBC_00249 TaxID=2975690 RepID=UPI002B1CFD87|nr:serine/threonine-protein kinase [Streptomyces sp. NBC_00249]